MIGSLPSWMSPWGLTAAALASLAVVLGAEVGIRWLTVAVALLGLVVGLVGAAFRGRGLVSLAIGAALCAGVLLLVAIAPTVLNPWWFTVSLPAEPDPNLCEVVPRKNAMGPGKALADDDWVEAATEGVRQDDLFIQVPSVRIGPLPERGPTSYLLVNVRLDQLRSGRTNTFERFTRDKHGPKLTDASGRSYAFLGDRVRKPTTKFDRWLVVDQLLVFDLPGPPPELLKLELPASAWGREGTCRFRIAEIVNESPPDLAMQIAQTTKMLRAPPAVPPDVTLGRSLFAKNCLECHTLFGSGGKVGPDLTGSKRGDLDFVVTSIIDPSAVIEKDYRPTLVQTTTGLVYNGILKKANADSITLLVPNKLVVVPRKQIEEMQDSKTSIMPTDLLKDLNEHEVRSLIAYLSGRGQVPMLATPENAPFFFFLGNDLTSWHSVGPAWSVDRGEIVAPGPLAGKPARLISDLHLPGDFHLTLRFRPGKSGRGAVLVGDARRPGLPTVPQVEFAAGEPLALTGVGGASVRGAPETKAEEWNKLEIIVVGKRMRVRLNDKDAVTATDVELPARRAIVLQGPGAAGQEVRFRYLDMRVPPAAK